MTSGISESRFSTTCMKTGVLVQQGIYQYVVYGTTLYIYMYERRGGVRGGTGGKRGGVGGREEG